jgi:hypothetical protein
LALRKLRKKEMAGFSKPAIEKPIGLGLKNVRPTAIGEYDEHVPNRNPKPPKKEHLENSS